MALVNSSAGCVFRCNIFRRPEIVENSLTLLAYWSNIPALERRLIEMRHDLIAKTPRRATGKTKRTWKWRGNALGIIVVCLALLVCAGFVRKAVRPVLLNYCEGHAVKQLRQEHKMAQKENHRLKRDIALYQSRSGAVAGARELGYVRPGEVPVSIEEPKVRR